MAMVHGHGPSSMPSALSHQPLTVLLRNPVAEPEEDFATMFEASLKAKRFEKGQTIEGTIVAIRPEVAFIDVGGKGEATIEVAELKDADGNLEVAVGDPNPPMGVSPARGGPPS